jgi:hypothetical protein
MDPELAAKIHASKMLPMVMITKGRTSRRRKIWIISARLQKVKVGQARSFSEYLPRTVRKSLQAREIAIQRCIYHWPHLKEMIP